MPWNSTGEPVWSTRDVGLVGARALGEGARQRQTAFVGSLQLTVLARRQGQHGIAHHARDPVLVVIGAVEDEDLAVDADLVGGQHHATGRVHRGDHVGHERGEVIVEAR